MAFFYDGISIRNQRKTNMDSLLLKERSIGGSAACIAAVCDGVGSLADGGFASSSAVKLLNRWFEGLEAPWRLGLRMRDAVLEINRRIMDDAREQGLQAATTCSALLLTEGRYYIVHTGDSRIYAWDGGGLRQLTEDQSQDGKLTGCLGRREQAELYYSEGSFQEGGFLLCSDGLYKRMDVGFAHTELLRTGRKQLQKTMERLVQHVVDQGEHDNISLAVILNTGS